MIAAWRRVPLWLRLVTSVLALAVLALAVSGFAGIRLLRAYLLEEVDDELRLALRLAPHDISASDLPNPYHFSRLSRTGELEESQVSALWGPDQAPDLEGLTIEDVLDRNGRPFTTGSLSGSLRWRALAVPVNGGADTLVVAKSLHDLDATVARLRSINLLVGLGVLGGLALAAYGTVRSALQPLEEMEGTAAGIAAGDMTRRVPDADPGTEVGRLGQALNTMLDRIEAALRDREASEATARQSEARMRQFVADASHELRTPLTSIRGFAELYRQGAFTDPARVPDVFRRIEDEATRMGLLVDDLLLLARLDQERPLAEEPVELESLVKEAVEAARATAPDRAIDLAEPSDRLVVMGDETRLRYVLSNLLDNALRHTPAGTPVEVSLGRTDGDRRPWAELAVRDHGPGLTAEQAPRVFERFYRTDAARTRATGGTGLGLSIVAAITAAHGGRAEVDSTPGQGATFRILLPLLGEMQ